MNILIREYKSSDAEYASEIWGYYTALLCSGLMIF